MDFEEYFRKNFNDGLSEPSKYILRFTFEAGQQSKQAEIDELQKKIDEIVKLVHDHTPDYWLDNMIQELLK